MDATVPKDFEMPRCRSGVELIRIQGGSEMRTGRMGSCRLIEFKHHDPAGVEQWPRHHCIGEHIRSRMTAIHIDPIMALLLSIESHAR
jgi:hypothetical protein